MPTLTDEDRDTCPICNGSGTLARAAFEDVVDAVGSDQRGTADAPTRENGDVARHGSNSATAAPKWQDQYGVCAECENPRMCTLVLGYCDNPPRVRFNAE